jgi:hypothetical protein
MSGFALFEQAVQDRMATQWAAGSYASIPVVYDNQIHGREKEKNPYLVLTILEGDGDQMSMGPEPVDVFVGVIAVQIFVREGTNSRLSRELGDAVSAIFRGHQFQITGSGWITCKTPSYARVGMADGWYQANVYIPFEREYQNAE